MFFRISNEGCQKDIQYIQDIQHVPFDDDEYELNNELYLDVYHSENEKILKNLTNIVHSYVKKDRISRIFRHTMENMENIKYQVIKHIIPPLKNYPLEFNITKDFYLFIATEKCTAKNMKTDEIISLEPYDALFVKDQTLTFTINKDIIEETFIFQLKLNTPVYSILRITDYSQYSGYFLDEIIINPEWFLRVFLYDIHDPHQQTIFYYVLSDIHYSFKEKEVYDENEEDLFITRYKYITALFVKIEKYLNNVNETPIIIIDDIKKRLQDISSFIYKRYIAYIDLLDAEELTSEKDYEDFE